MSRRGLNIARAAVVVLCAGPLIAPTARAQEIDPKVGAAIEQWIADLDDVSLDRRETAQASLGDIRRCTLPVIEKRLFDPGLSQEQRLRLTSAGYRLFINSVRGAMGVQFSDATPQGVVIGRTIEGFDSRIALRPEDVIRSISGRPVVDQDMVRAMIISHDPGEEVPIGLLRNGEPLTVTLRMGRFDQLSDRTGGPDERSLQQAWQLRLARLARQAAARPEEPIDAVGVAAEQEDFDLALALLQTRVPSEPDIEPASGVASLVAGGEPRSSVGWSAAAYLMLRGGGMMGLPDPAGELRRELIATQRNLIELQDELLEVQAVIEDPNTPAARRQEMRLRGQLMEAQLRQYEAQVRAIMERLAHGPQPIRAVP